MMKRSRMLRKTGKRVALVPRMEVVHRGMFFEVLFFDENGMSILAKEKKLEDASARLRYHWKRFKAGKLLKEDKSVWE